MCRAEIIDPNERLIGEFKAHKKDPYAPQCDEVLDMKVKNTVSQRGNDVVRVDWVTPYRQFSTYLLPDARIPAKQHEYSQFMLTTDNGNVKPKTVAYRKTDSKFFSILGYNQPADVEPVKEMVG